MILTVIIRDPTNLIHFQEACDKRTVRIELIPEQIKKLELRHYETQGGKPYYEHILELDHIAKRYVPDLTETEEMNLNNLSTQIDYLNDLKSAIRAIEGQLSAIKVVFNKGR
jgi:hypothetical protein